MIATRDDEVSSSAPCDIARLMNCTHEEADTRTYGAEHEMNKILLRTADTDVVVLGATYRFVFGTGTTFRYIDATYMSQALGKAKCSGLPAFHALTGCDATQLFAGTEKRTAWTAWNAYDDARSAMCTMSRMPTTESVMNVLPTIERLIVIMYDRVSSESSVNSERLELFTQKGREIENIPPTPDALAQHVMRVSYEAGHVWGQATTHVPQLPSPPNFGWTWELASAQCGPCSHDMWMHQGMQKTVQVH